MFALMELMLQLATPAPVHLDLLRWASLPCHLRGGAPVSLLGMSFLFPSPSFLPVTPTGEDFVIS